MSGEYDNLYQAQFVALEEMTRDELIEECQRWRNLWTWIPEDAKYYLTKVGQQVRLMMRNYRGYLGRQLQPRFKLEALEVEVVCKEFNYEDGKQYLEFKTLIVPVTQFSHIEYVHERELIEDESLLLEEAASG